MAPGPIDIKPSVHPTASSGGNRSNSGGITSNLTSALRAAGEAGRQPNFNQNQSSNVTSAGPQPDRGPTSQGINIGGIASAINHSGKAPRRESLAQSEAGRGSLMNGGMSWGGVSVGSWIRDDIIMTGTSPFSYQSPSYHSSSYLPKLEANFFRDFSCCGKTLPSLHDLLQHYEEVHASQSGNQVQLPESVREFTRNNSITSPTGLTGSMSAGLSRLVQQQQMHHQKMAQQSQGQNINRGDRLGSMSLASGGGVDVAEEMEMDDDDMTPPPNMNQMMPNPQPGLRLATQMPPNLMNNPTVSSVNTPNMPNPSTPATERYRSPDSSVPGTPGGTDIKSELDGLSQFGNMNLGYMGEELDMTIHDPGKHLFNPVGNAGARAGFPQMSLQQLRAAREQSEMTRRMNMEFMGNNVPGASIPGNEALLQSLWAMQEDKPYKCPVIGCEKAYKNQNGLKYHKNHGHVNQTLHQNPDGTYSIVNPETSIPYPGTMGMEKEKPYKCEFCGKRYKNLNGLKYHRAHSNHQFAAGLMMAGMGGMPPLDDAIGEDY